MKTQRRTATLAVSAVILSCTLVGAYSLPANASILPVIDIGGQDGLTVLANLLVPSNVLLSDAGEGRIKVSWTKAPVNILHPLTHYVVRILDSTGHIVKEVNVSSTTTSIVSDVLSNGNYQAQVIAVALDGISLPALSNNVLNLNVLGNQNGGSTSGSSNGGTAGSGSTGGTGTGSGTGSTNTSSTGTDTPSSGTGTSGTTGDVSTAPAMVTNIQALVKGTTKMEISWNKSNDAVAGTDYYVQVVNNKLVRSYKTSNFWLTASGLASTSYKIAVTACNGDLCGATLVKSVSSLRLPGKVQQPVVKRITKTTAFVDWVKPSARGGASVSKYVIQVQRHYKSGWKTVRSIDVKGKTSYAIKKFAPDTNYRIRVTALNANAVNYEKALRGTYSNFKHFETK